MIIQKQALVDEKMDYNCIVWQKLLHSTENSPRTRWSLLAYHSLSIADNFALPSRLSDVHEKSWLETFNLDDCSWFRETSGNSTGDWHYSYCNWHFKSKQLVTADKRNSLSKSKTNTAAIVALRQWGKLSPCASEMWFLIEVMFSKLKKKGKHKALSREFRLFDSRSSLVIVWF